MSEVKKFFGALNSILSAKFEMRVKIEKLITAHKEFYSVVFYVPSGNIRIRAELYRAETEAECKQFVKFHRMTIS